MDAKYRNDVNRVIDKLETMENLFEFYCHAREKTGFNEDSINGLIIFEYLSLCVVSLILRLTCTGHID
jgi:hypothetical protein